MKLSFMTFACPQWTLAQIIRGAKDHACDGFEPRVTADHAHGIELSASPEERRRAGQMVRDAGLAVSCVATSCRFAATDRAQRTDNVESLRRHLELARDVGATRLRVFGGARPEGLNLESAIAIVAQDLLAAADFAAQCGVIMCLETHDDFSRGSSVGRVLRAADHDHIRANWDVMHPYRAGEDLAETLRWLDRKIAHVHFHDSADDGKALVPGDGWLPIAEYVRALARLHFDGYVSAEIWNDAGSPETILRRYAEQMRRYERLAVGSE
ncbi:MAG TPA: sugar phosphate isomerase/epimerase family protein [Armatimonadota bacterium]|nr:sugar phosphate isomerase/epimerase family protein [Armatimonadota bacterium]